MKKIIFILISTLLATTIFSQTYTLSNRRDSIRTYIQTNLSLSSSNTRNMTTAKINYVINEALAKVCTDYPALMKASWVIIDKDSTGSTLPSDWIDTWTVFKKDDTVWYPLEYMPKDSLRVLHNTPAKNIHVKNMSDQPRYYYHHGRKIYTHPKDLMPITDPDSLYVMYRAMDAKLLADDSTVHIYPEYIEKLVYLSCSKISFILYDFDLSKAFLDKYEGLK